MKLEVGQEIFLKPTGNAVRRNSEVREAKITKIGKKYFEVDILRTRFSIETLCQDNGEYSSDYKGYLSRQEIIDEAERNSLYRQICEFFRYGSTNVSLSTDQLRQISRIITP